MSVAVEGARRVQLRGEVRRAISICVAFKHDDLLADVSWRLVRALSTLGWKRQDCLLPSRSKKCPVGGEVIGQPISICVSFKQR